MKNLSWYNSLIRPENTPPDYVFTYVWPILYIMMFSSLFIVIKKISQKNKSLAIILFFIQLILNFSWSYVFFGAKNINGGVIIISLILIILSITIYEFFKISKLSALLLIPYFIWIIFALYLNISIYLLNK